MLDRRRLLIILTMIFSAAVTPIAIRITQSHGVPSLVIVLIRLWLVSLALLPWIWLRYRREVSSLTARQVLLFGISGFWLALNLLLLFVSLDYTSVREVMEAEAWVGSRANLKLALGKDVAGMVRVVDLTAMPHLLIAGSTGAGKSVCLTSLITGLLCQTTPDELHLVLIDPKMVELVTFDGVPHLRMPVVTDIDDAVPVLTWVSREMARRYRIFNKAGVRNITSYNANPTEATDGKPLPYLVTVIDELADLMMTAPGDVERLLARLAQLARATGILSGMRYGAGLALSRHLRADVISPSAIDKAVASLVPRLRRFAAEVEPSRDEPGVFWLGASGLSLLHPRLEEWAGLVHGDLAGASLHNTVAVGFSRFGSYAAAKTCDRTTVFHTPEEEHQHVRGVRLDRLDFAPKVRDLLARLGIHTLAGFLDLPAAQVRSRLGREAHRLHRLAAGDLWSPLHPEIPSEPITARVFLDYPESDHRRLAVLVEDLLEPLLGALEQRHEVLTVLLLRLRLDDRSERAEALRPARPTLDRTQILELLRLRLEATALTAGVTEIGMELLGTSPDVRQGELFHGASTRDHDAANRALVTDCETLRALGHTLRGTTALNWNTDTALSSWPGVTTGGTPTRVTGLNLSGQNLNGKLPADLGRLFALTTLNLSSNSLTGDVPAELGWLERLTELRLSGNPLTGCLPLRLRSVATHDLAALALPYCQPPAPTTLAAGPPGEASVALTWAAVAHAATYQVETRAAGGAPTSWGGRRPRHDTPPPGGALAGQESSGGQETTHEASTGGGARGRADRRGGRSRSPVVRPGAVIPGLGRGGGAAGPRRRQRPAVAFAGGVAGVPR